MSDSYTPISSAANAPKNAHAFAQSRSWARRFAMQAFYQWQIAKPDLAELDQQFAENEEFSRIDQDYFYEIVHRGLAMTDQLDAAILPYLDRPIAQLDPVERAILWVGTYELLKRIDVPYRVIINEAVEMAKRFGADGGHKFINGILDKTAQVVRPQTSA